DGVDGVTERVIVLKNGSIFDIPSEEVYAADRLFIDINFDDNMMMVPILSKLKPGCRLLSYMRFDNIETVRRIEFYETIKTSWAPKNGHMFHYFEKTYNEAQSRTVAEIDALYVDVTKSARYNGDYGEITMSGLATLGRPE